TRQLLGRGGRADEARIAARCAPFARAFERFRILLRPTELAQWHRACSPGALSPNENSTQRGEDHETRHSCRHCGGVRPRFRRRARSATATAIAKSTAAESGAAGTAERSISTDTAKWAAATDTADDAAIGATAEPTAR